MRHARRLCVLSFFLFFFALPFPYVTLLSLSPSLSLPLPLALGLPSSSVQRKRTHLSNYLRTSTEEKEKLHRVEGMAYTAIAKLAITLIETSVEQHCVNSYMSERATIHKWKTYSNMRFLITKVAARITQQQPSPAR